MVISYSKILFSLLFLLLVGCAGVPVQEMSDARQAVEAARRAGAENNVNASQELSAAEALLQKAEQALSDGDYATARKAAEAARDQAVSAQDKSSPP